MTGRILMQLLSMLPDADLDLEIYIYNANSEDGSFCRTIQVLTAEDEPYEKGDGPWTPEGRDQAKWRGVPRDQKLLYIRS